VSIAGLAAWYGTLAPRDQRILRIGAPLALLIVAAWILLPLQKNLSQARAQLRQQQADLDWMRRVGPTLAAAGPGQPVAGSKPAALLGLINRAAGEAGLGKAITGTTLVGDNAMRVQFENADFNLLVGLLHRLSTQQGLRVEDLDVTGVGDAGMVNASMQLRPGS
jgi:type II secretory pathway component PulM